MDGYFLGGLLVSAAVVGLLLGIRKLCIDKWGEAKGKVIGDRIAYAFVGILFAAMAIFLVSLASGGPGGGSGSGGSKTCPVCGRTFSDSSNISSIRRRNMCSSCYSNYQWGQNARGRGTASHHDECDKEHETIVLSLFPYDAELDFTKMVFTAGRAPLPAIFIPPTARYIYTLLFC